MNSYGPQGFSGLSPVVKNILLLNLFAFIMTALIQYMNNFDIANTLGLHYFTSTAFKPIQLVSYMFLHANIEHIFFNMFAVWMFGNVLESFWGPKKFFIFYMATGIGAGLVQMLVAFIRIQMLSEQVPIEIWDMIQTQGADILMQGKNFVDPVAGELNAIINSTTVGASGAVFGLLMAFGMLFPDSMLYVFFAIPIRAKWFVMIYGAIELFSGLRNSPGDNVAHFAHLGGMVFGFILIKYWRHKGTY